MNDSAVLVGFIITIVIVGLLGGTTLVIFICIKWRDYVKRRQIMSSALPMRQPTRRRRRLRVQPANDGEHAHSGHMELPPPYSESDNMPPPPYTVNPLLRYENMSRGNSRRNSSRLTTPLQSRGRNSVLRHSSFSVHLNIEGTHHTPSLTPAGSMFESPLVSIHPHTNSEITTQQNSSDDVG